MKERSKQDINEALHSTKTKKDRRLNHYGLFKTYQERPK